MRNSTIIVKKKNLACGHFDYNFSGGYCKQCATQRSTKKRVDKFEGVQEDESLKNLIEDADREFSIMMRLKYCDHNGYVGCFTCNISPRPYTQMQLGHFIPRSHLNTRWLEENGKIQCESCNCLKGGELRVFSENLEKESPGRAEWLESQKNEVWKPSRDDIRQLILSMRHKIKLLKTKLKK